MSIWKEKKVEAINPFEVAMNNYDNINANNEIDEDNNTKTNIANNLNKTLNVPDKNYKKIIDGNEGTKKRNGYQTSIYLSEEANYILEQYSASINKSKSRIIDELIKQALK